MLLNPLTNKETRLPRLPFRRACPVWAGTDNPIHDRDVIVVHEDKTLRESSWAFYNRTNEEWIVSERERVPTFSISLLFEKGGYFRQREVTLQTSSMFSQERNCT